MPSLLESPGQPLSLADVAGISRQLADDIGRLMLKTEGFSVSDYLSLGGPYLVEYRDGCLQVLPMPTALHQALAFVFANLLLAFSKGDPLSRVKLAPFRIALNDREYREPDVCFMLGEHASRRTNLFWRGADLVVEVISPSNRAHDTEIKPAEFAAAGIPEYWLIDPEKKSVRVLALRGSEYAVLGEFGLGEVATSELLGGFAVDVADLFAQAEAQA
jgi:Uma2 family endonuclease